jgi:YbgC/YbaW family acyl-CoA thioester hydrolase
MAILHTPRTLAAIARGMLKRRRRLAATTTTTDSVVTTTSTANKFVGFGPVGSIENNNNNKKKHEDDNAHIYRSRPNVLWDADYLGHMNNAAYLTHTEYARWEWTAENGALRAMYQKGMHFVVTNSAIRFRREISLVDKFEIHSFLQAIDDRHLWMHQTFRSRSDNSNNRKDSKGKGRILAQVLVQAVAVQNRKVVPPSTMLAAIGVPGDVVDSLLWKEDASKDSANNDNDNNGNDNGNKDDAVLFLQRFKDLDEAFRKEATADDERLLSSKGE